MVKQKYYSLSRMKEIAPEFAILFGERSNGKSYAVKEELLTNAWKNKRKFIYLRRWQVDLNSVNVTDYFSDAPVKKITNGERDCVTCFRNEIFFGVHDKDGKVERKEKIGRAFYLGGAEHYKSLALPDYDAIDFEEFNTDLGYLPNEIRLFMSIVSTVARRRKITVYMIANAVTPICPYFREWELVGVRNQKQGTIDIYEKTTDQEDENGNPVVVRIAVEYCEESGNNSRMFFGKSSKMITSGRWQSYTHPHLPYPYEECTSVYAVLIEYESERIKMELLKRADECFCYCYPYTSSKPIKRKLVDYVHPSPYITQKLYPNIKGEKIMGMLIRMKKVFFSDDLTGTLFYQIEKQKGGYV